MAGKTLDEIRRETASFIRLIRGEDDPQQWNRWGDMASLKGVIRYPVRVKYATLAWHALLDAIEDSEK